MKLKLRLNGTPHEMDIAALKPDLEVRIDGRGHALRETGTTGALRHARIDGEDITYHQARSGNRAFLHLGGRTWIVEFVDPRDAAREKVQGSGDIRAPMPGVVVSVEKQPGDPVTAGDTILTIESMKLQTNLTAERDGVLAEILKSEGDVFEKGAIVARLQEEEDSDA